MSTPSLFRWSREQFLEAARAGWFADRKVELLGGIVYTMTTNPPHTASTLNLEDLFRNLLSPLLWFVARDVTVEMGS